MDRPIRDGRLAWLYVIPHAVDWQTPAAEAERRGYQTALADAVTEGFRAVSA